ncbi:dTTP/UTP pyrophosphatase-like isoform X2 [Watersipora subatra]|uniref:dTTP/UTP pyrophosphatase-like isoform X2 n=1 Tax=Watersipora subatra TaxID=2589382 RepID=UPI00355C35AE
MASLFSVDKIRRFSNIVLASGSPRRKEILVEKGGVKDLVIRQSTYEEESKALFDHSDVYSYITGIAKGKVEQVARLEKAKDENEQYMNTLFIGADTVVLQNEKIFEKPKDRTDAASMLKRDASKHQVCSGVVLLVPNPSPASEEEFLSHVFHETTDVLFAPIDDATIEKYLDLNEWMDKAGGYGIQAQGAQLIESISGDYYNVMGFPLCRFCKELRLFIESLEHLST